MTIDGLEVLLTRPETSTPPRTVGSRLMQILGGNAGPSLAVFHGRNHNRAFTLNYRFKTRADCITFEDFRFKLAGAAGSFWLPSWHAELAPTAGILTSATALMISTVGYNATYLVDDYSRAIGRWIYLLADDGTLHISQVLSAVDGSSTDVLTLATAPISDFVLGKFHVGFLYCVRQITDNGETIWENDEATIALSVTTKTETAPFADAGLPAPIVELQTEYDCAISYKIDWLDFNDGATYEILYSDTGAAPWTTLVSGVTAKEYELPTPALKNRFYIVRAHVLDSISTDSNIITLAAVTAEAMMCAVQERYRASQGASAANSDVTGLWIDWPNRHSPDTTDPGHYPSDGFYTADIANPTYAIALVVAIATALNDGGFAGAWKTTGSWNGLVTIPSHDTTSLGVPDPSLINAGNYQAKLIDMVDCICLMKWLLVQATQTDVSAKDLFVYKTAGGVTPTDFASGVEAANCANDHKDTVDWGDLVWLGDWNHALSFSSGNHCGEKYRSTTSTGNISVTGQLQWVFMTGSSYAWAAELGNCRGKLAADLTNYGPNGELTMFYFPVIGDAESDGVSYPKDQWNDATADIGGGLSFTNWKSLQFVLTSDVQRTVPRVAGGATWFLFDQVIRVTKSPLKTDGHWTYYPT